MYISRLIINPACRAAYRDMASPYEMHRTLATAFPGKGKGGYGRILWRLDHLRCEDQWIIFIHSEKQPDWYNITYKDGYGDYFADDIEDNPVSREITTEMFRFAPGKRLSFRLLANPTKKIGTTNKTERLTGKKNNGQRIPLIKPEEQIDWLRRKGESGGIILRTINITQQNHSRKIAGSKKTDTGNRHQITMLGVRFEGILEVTDTEKFRQTLVNGIGPGKGLGMGLLSIAPV